MGGDDEPPKYQVEDVLNKKKPPPQILDLNGLDMETREDFQTARDKIPDYRIRAEKAEETASQLATLRETMRSHRIKKKELYVELLHPTKLPEEGEIEEPTVNLTQTSHDRAHTVSVPEVNVSLEEAEERVPDTRGPRASRGSLGRAPAPQGLSPREEGGSSSRAPSVSSTASRQQAPPAPPPFLGVTVAMEPYLFADPCPPSMRQVRISDLSSVDISWKMLTLARPTSKVDEDIFSKLVQLDKLRVATRKEEEALIAAKGGVDPFYIVMPPSSSRGGVGEKLIKVCEECQEEFCTGSCIIFQYDSYQRLLKEEDEDGGDPEEETKKKKKRGKSAKKKKGEDKKSKKSAEV